MQLSLRKLGRIDEATLDIKPLTVFFGPNNTNKTWAVWTLFAALEPLSTGPTSSTWFTEEERPDSDFTRRIDELSGPLVAAIESGDENTSASVVLNIPELYRGAGDTVTMEFDPERLSSIIGAATDSLGGAAAKVVFRVDELDEQLVELRVAIDRTPKAVNLEWRWQRGDRVRRTSKTTYVNRLERAVVQDHVYWSAHQVLGAVIAFPAERAGLVAVSDLVPPGRHPLPEAINEFLLFLRACRTIKIDPSLNNRAYKALLSRIVQGQIGLVGEKTERALVFSGTTGVQLPIASASSLVRSLAGFSLYLHHFARPGDIILIDELEMNAHPKAQLALVELMAALVRHGIRVVFTTHSPYVLDHLNNLMEASRLPKERHQEAAEQFELKTADAFIPTERVAAWAFEENAEGRVTVRNAMDESLKIITGSTFGPASDKVLNLYGTLLDMQESNSSGGEGRTL